MGEAPHNKPVEIAVFDFDGTCISGNSPVILVTSLMKQGLLGKGISLKIGLWGLAYKFRLPQNESWVRGAVFSAFEGKPREEVDAFLRRFYNERLECIFRAQADAEIRKHSSQGREVWVVSATFEPSVLEAMEHHGFTHELSTQMATDEKGCYTRNVLGLPVEGNQKLALLTQCANERYGVGGWVLTHAYGDHHSDRALLGAAQEAFAVCPDRPLRRTAAEHGWKTLDWN